MLMCLFAGRRHHTQDLPIGSKLIELPEACQLTYGRPVDNDDPKLLALIEQVPKELWGAKLALKV